ncbi:DUF805 domain-containing protein [Phenylobacterium sp.]|uniref:DUF805 domain-containing protein n=1 Tax=Phenylobacterium sp. TaxID=1871053 RepID=UPI003BA89301
MMGLMRWFSLEGRSGRREFNLVCLPLLAWVLLLGFTLETFAPNGIKNLGWMLATFFLFVAPFGLIIPAIARRLHDLGFSAGWLFALGFAVKLFRIAMGHIPDDRVRLGLEILAVGAVLGLFLMLIARRGQAGENQFGPELAPSSSRAAEP